MFRLAVHSVAGSILLWGHFPVEGIFPLELTWVQTPFPPKTLSDESINRGLVCAHMHLITQTQKILTFMSYTGKSRQQKHTQHAPSTKTECDYLNGWIKKWSHTQKSRPKMVNLRDIAGERRRRRTTTTTICTDVDNTFFHMEIGNSCTFSCLTVRRMHECEWLCILQNTEKTTIH